MKERRRVLLIETENDLALLMKTYFLRKNYEVFIVHSILDALQQINIISPDLIFVDASACQDIDADIALLRKAAPEAKIHINGSTPRNDLKF